MIRRIAHTTLLTVLSLCVCMIYGAMAQDKDMKRRPPANDAESMAVEPRVALVIGNGAYEFDPLRNPANDARAMASALKQLSFDVTEKANLAEKDMKRAIDDFGQKLRSGGVGLFYYSGHGLQVNGMNYLIPIGAKIDIEQDVEYEAVNVGRVLGKMENAENRLNIIILDACRNNPYHRSFKSPSQGLASMSAPTGTIIAYATKENSVANDGGSGSNGLYTGKLIEQMKMPGLKIEDVFKRVRSAVMEATGRRQEPREYVSMVGDFYFKLPSAAPASQPAGSVPATGGDREMVFWQSVMQGDSIGAFEEYLRKYPTGEYAGLARLKIDALKAAQQAGGSGQAQQKPGTGGGSVQMAGGTPPEEKLPAKPAGRKAGDKWKDPVTGMEIVWVPGGSYQMGCGGWTSDCSDSEKPVHEVSLDGFWMGKTEVTVGQYMKFARETGRYPEWKEKGSTYNIETGTDDYYKKMGSALTSENYPVVGVSWEDAKAYAEWLSKKTGEKFRLPSEAEWEYAARSGGKSEKYAGGGDIDRVAWYSGNSGGKTHEVGKKAENGLGLCDMSGNVWEWCMDIYSNKAYSKHQSKNPICTEKDFSGGSCRVFRGGCWSYKPAYVRCAHRDGVTPASRGDHVGFRLVRT